MKQDDKAKKVGAAKILARKKASKDRSQAAAVDFVKPDANDDGYSRAENAAFGLPNDDDYKKFDKYVRNANAKANKGRISQTVTGYTPSESTMVDDDGSRSTMVDREVKQYEADNKGVSATRGRQIQEKAKEYKGYGTSERSAGDIEAYTAATRDVNRFGNDSIVTPGKIARKGVDKAYEEALHATWDHSRPDSKSVKAERARLKKAKQRGDLGRGAGSSGATLNYGR